MQPFRVICETCHARLKVSSASAVGEIHACPKCGSMVHIRPPAEGHASPPSAPNSESIEIGAPALPSFDDVVVVAAPLPPEFIGPPAPVVQASGGWQSTAWWGIGGAAILVAGGLVAATWIGRTESTPEPVPVAQTTMESSTGSAPDAATDNASTQLTNEISPVELPGAAPDASAGETVATAADTADSTPTLPTLPELPPVEAEPAASDDADNTETVAQASPPAAPATETPQIPAPADEQPRRAPVMKFDPLDFDPSQFSFNAGDSTAATPDSSSIPRDGEVEAAANVDEADVNADDKEPVSAPAIDRSLTVRLGPMPSGTAPPHRTAEQLATHLDSYTVSDMPLSRFVEMVSGLADVAVTLDPIQLQLAGVSPRQLVAADSNDVTVEKLLRDVLAKHRLELVENDDHVGVALAGGERRRAVVYDVADLAGTSDAKPIASLVQQFVAPNSWTAAGGGTIGSEGTKLRIEHSQSVRHEVLIFCERLRLARALPQRSKFPASLLAAHSAYETLASTLKQPTTFTFLPWTRLTDVLRHWQEASKLSILVDWSALAEVELGPSSPVACSAIDRSWEDVFDETLASLGLGWWAVDGETIQITSEDALDQIQRIEFYIVPKSLRDQFASDEALIESLQQEVAELAARSTTNPQKPVIKLDEPSGLLIMLGTPPSHRFLTQRFARDAKQVVLKDP